MASELQNTMIAVESRPTVAKALRARPPLPREHGAWGILLIPFATAVGVRGVLDLKVALLLAGVLCFYLARTSYLKCNVKWTAILLAGSVVCTTPLLFVWHLWWLAAFGAAAAPLAFRKTERSVAMQLLAVCGLTLTAPAAWYAGTRHLDTEALLLWSLNVLYFAGGMFYVKMHVAAAMRRSGTKIKWGMQVLIYYMALLLVLIALALGKAVSFWVMAAYVPVAVRAFLGVAKLSPVLRIKRLGWTEVGYSVVYAVLLIIALR